MEKPTLIPVYRGGLAAIMRALHRLLIRPRVYVGHTDNGQLEDILVYRGDVYVSRDDAGSWQVEVRGIDAVYRQVLR